MHRNKILFFFVCVFYTFTSCIEPFTPKIKNENQSKYVVSGQITDIVGLQNITVSQTSSVSNPKFTPVNHCTVKISDNKGNVFLPVSEDSKGQYNFGIPEQYLIAGSSYKVDITTPDGTKIESDYDVMPADCPNIDSVYYIREDLPTGNSSEPLQGIRIYLDFNGGASPNRYYYWAVQETWEYHSDFLKQDFYDGRIEQRQKDSSIYYCWRTQFIKEIFTFSTVNLSQNAFRKHPLYFIDNHTSRLKYGYSILVFQYALSEAAFGYWDKLRINSTQNGGLSQQQPLPIKGNLKNITNPQQDVLGFFGAASAKNKRIFIRNLPNLVLDFFNNCSGPEDLPRGGWKNFTQSDYPIYIIYISGILKILDRECVDCRLQGGVTTKPDFWQ